MTPKPEWLQYGAEPAQTEGAEFSHLNDAIDRLFANADRPTAILCGNDKMAMRVIFILQRRGLRVPDDVSVVGFDDFRLISEALDPALTTVGLPYREMGEIAARHAFSDEASPAATLRVPCRAIMRGTVAPPPKSGRKK